MELERCLMKTCSKCLIEKQKLEFYNDKRKPDGLSSSCRKCRSIQCSEYRKYNREKIAGQKREYYEKNKNKKAEYDKEYRRKNKSRIKKRDADYKNANQDAVKARKSQWYARNKERLAAKAHERYIKHREEIREYNKAYRELNKAIIKERKATYVKENREAVLASKRRYAKENKDIELARSNAWRQANRERFEERRARWNRDNPMKLRTYAQNRISRKKNAKGLLTEQSIKWRFDYYANSCYYCGVEGDLQVEHRIPLSRGGTNWPSNIVPACKTCNVRKNAKTETEYRQWLIGYRQ